MAMSAAITWEFNASASANMVGGGGFVTGASGTDVSRYTTAAAIEAAYPTSGSFSGTNLACADGDVAGAVITSATHNFVAADVGNVVHVTAGTGWTVGWYQIVSCTGNAATLDRAVGTDGAKTDGTWYLGGALSLNSTLDDDFFDQLVAGQKVYFLKGNYTLGEAVSAGSNGTSRIPIFVTGYTGTRDTACNGLDRPNIACGTNTFTTGQYYKMKNFSFTGTPAGSLLVQGTANIFENIKSIHSISSTNRSALAGTTWGTFLNCEAISYQGYGINSLGSVIIGCYVHHSLNAVVGASSAITPILSSVLANNITSALLLGSTTNTPIIGNTFYGSESKKGTGIISGANYSNFIFNNIFYGFVTGISSTANDVLTYVGYNDFYNNTTPVSNVTELGNDKAVDPTFVNAPGTLIDTCETQWSFADGDVTLTADNAVFQVGVKSMKAVAAAALGAGDIACANAIASTNMSAYNGIGLWVRSTVALAAGDWQFLLSDQANCANIILAYNLPAMAANTWYWLYLGNQSMASATAIISIGFKQIVDKGAMTLYADDIRGCNNDFSLTAGSGCIDTGFSYCKPLGDG